MRYPTLGQRWPAKSAKIPWAKTQCINVNVVKSGTRQTLSGPRVCVTLRFLVNRLPAFARPLYPSSWFGSPSSWRSRVWLRVELRNHSGRIVA